MAQDSQQQQQQIKTQEQWKWSEMQGLELFPLESTSNAAMEVSKDAGAEKPSSIPPVGFGELFRFADKLDYVLMGIGTAGAIVHGCSLPIFLRFFADLVNSFGSNTNNMDKMMHEVLKASEATHSSFLSLLLLVILINFLQYSFILQYSYYFLLVGAAIWVASWAGTSPYFLAICCCCCCCCLMECFFAEISCWMWTGERQSTRMRIRYLEAALNQDVQYFDTDIRTSDVVFAINTDAVMVQDAISEKVAQFLLSFFLSTY